MSLLTLLDDDKTWQQFLARKKKYSHLPDRVLKEYESFIMQKEYKILATKIISDNYIFSIPKKVLIGKMGKTKKRTVYMFEKEENYLLKLLTYLLYKYDFLFSPNLYSFRQQSGVKKAINDLMKKNKKGLLYAYKVDIKNYFNSINVDILLKNLKEDLQDQKLYEFLENILDNDKVIYNDEIIKEDKGVMAGVPISAFLANYYLKDLDRYFFENKIPYFRYADDILVLAQTKEELINYQNYIKKYLKSVFLEVNPEKEHFYNPGDELEFLGFSIQKNTIDLSQNTIKKIKGKIRRSAKGLRRWMLRKDASLESTLKAMNRKYNLKFFGKKDTDLTWKYWFFPTLTTSKSLKEVDQYMQMWQRYIATGKHNKKNFEKVPYTLLKKCGYKSLVNEYYNYKTKD